MTARRMKRRGLVRDADGNYQLNLGRDRLIMLMHSKELGQMREDIITVPKMLMRVTQAAELGAANALKAGFAEHNELIDELNATMSKLAQEANACLIPLGQVIDKAHDAFDEVDHPAERIRLAAEQDAKQQYERAVAAAQAERDSKLECARLQYDAATSQARETRDAQVKDAVVKCKEVRRRFNNDKATVLTEFKQREFVLMRRLKRQGATVTGHARAE